MTNIDIYLEQLTEQKVSCSKSIKDLNKDLENKITPLNTSDIDGVQSAKSHETPEHLQNVEELTNQQGVKYNIMSTENAFDRLFRQAIDEDFELDPAGMDSSAESGFGSSPDMGENSDTDMGDIDADPEHVGGVKEVVELLQQALEKLTAFAGEEEEEYEEYESEDEGDADLSDFTGEGEDSAPVTEEETEHETLGHAIVDNEKLKKGMDKSSNMVVKGAVPGVGGKAQTPAGQKNDGKLSAFGKKHASLQSKGGMKVPGRASRQGFAFEK